jgi:hypothetical protein
MPAWPLKIVQAALSKEVSRMGAAARPSGYMEPDSTRSLSVWRELYTLVPAVSVTTVWGILATNPANSVYQKPCVSGGLIPIENKGTSERGLAVSKTTRCVTLACYANRAVRQG